MKDLHHDSFIARARHDTAFNYITQLGLQMDTIIQFCDNCASQYKSHRPFDELARSALNIICVFFGEKHGKSHCDGFFGRLKSWMTRQIKTGTVIVTDASDFYRCCKNITRCPWHHLARVSTTG